jgi:N-acetylglutamate synthase-like GNAT family acetyltransferase
MADEIHVRVATPKDFEGVMALAAQVSRENGIFEPTLEMVASDIWAALNHDHGIIGVIGPMGGILEGFVLLRIGNTWYSQSEIIEEKTVFVSPKFRSAKGGRARKLCEFSKKVADELELPLLIGILSNQRTKGKVEMYKRVFGDPAGAFFLYGAHTGDWNKNALEGSIGEK